MSEPTPEQLAKLPRWARSFISSLNAQLIRAQAEAEMARTLGPDDTDTFADPYADRPVYLERGSLVRFMLGAHCPDEHVTCHVEQDARGARLLVVGGDSLQIELMSSNIFSIKTVHR